MKIAFINVTCTGSTGSIMTAQAEAAAKKNNECIVFYGRGKAKESENIKKIRIGSKFGVLWHAFRTRVFGKNGHASKTATKKMIKQLELFKPDVIQMHNLHGYYVNIKLLFDYLKKSDAKVIWTLHDCWSFTGGCAHFTAAGCDKWEKQCKQCKNRKTYPKCLVDTTRREYKFKKKIFTGVANMTIVTPCEWLSDLVKMSFLSEYDTVCIPNGIDTEAFVNADDKKIGGKIKKLPEKYFIGVAAKWDGRKRPELFIKTAEKLSEEGYSAVMVGKADKKLLEGKSGIIINFEKITNKQLLGELYRRAICTVSTSVEDTFPTIGLESMACGTPVVYADVCGCPEQVLGDPVTGFVFTPDDPFDAAEKIREAEKNLPKLRANCIEKSKKLFKTEKMCKKYLELYYFNGR